mmetsp:Transcript_10319/g.36047  ORF Transcript_10319/g.36047 Transcript_10319/m.36047 type:complete len:254 (-) Transcript_10319:603-1364(-)
MSVLKQAMPVSNPSTTPSVSGMFIVTGTTSTPSYLAATARVMASSSLGSLMARNMSSASACSAVALAAWPPLMMPTLSVVSPSSGDDGHAVLARSPRAATSGSMALLPRCGYPLCAATPVDTRRHLSMPFCRRTSFDSVGSPTTIAVGASRSALAAIMPLWSVSSLTTYRMPTSRSIGVPACASAKACAALSCAARTPLVSQAPRPWMARPSALSVAPKCGGTVSMCELKRNRGERGAGPSAGGTGRASQRCA